MTAAAFPSVQVRSGHDAVGTLRLVLAELRWIFRRPRTLVVLGLLAVIPIIVGVGLKLVSNGGGGNGQSEGSDALLGSAIGNGFVLPIATLTLTLALLLPLAAAMTGADAIAGEVSNGTLRGWLIAPVSRGRLLAVKAIGVAIVALVASVAISAIGMITGLIINGTGSLFTLDGTTLSVWDAAGRVAMAAGWVTLQLWAVGAVALAISACTEHPLLVVVSVLAGDIVFTILGYLSAVDWLHPFLLTRDWSTAIGELLRDPVPTGQLGEGALRAVSYIFIALSLAYARIITRDG
jgi:ABC-2 type transport system permease protein